MPGEGVVIGYGSGTWLISARCAAGQAARVASRLQREGVTRAVFVSLGDQTLLVHADPTPMAVRLFTDTHAVPRHIWRTRQQEAYEAYREQGLTRTYVRARYQRGTNSE